MAHHRRPLRLFLLIGVQLVVFGLAGELLARATHLADRLNGFPRRLYMATDDPDLPYVLRPGVDTEVRGTPVKLNEYGMRGPSVTRLPPPHVHRILVLGGSVAFGEGVPVEEAFPALLERELNARGAQRYEVLNAGVQGYNTAAELAYLRQRGLGFAPHTVVVGFHLDDFDRTPVMGPLGILTRDQEDRVRTTSLANVSEFYLVLRWLVLTRGRLLFASPAPPPSAAAPGGQRFGDLDRYVSARRKQYYRQPWDARWQAMVNSLNGLGAEAAAHGFRLLIATLPDGDQVGVPEPDLLPQQKLAALCAEAGLSCLDLYPSFAAAAEDLYFDIPHPNPAGHRLIARVLADHLLARPAER